MKRLRIFAGPNGSGKSTIIKVVTDAGVHLGLYINADEYKKELNKTHRFNFSNPNIIPSEQDFQDTYHNSSLFDSSKCITQRKTPHPHQNRHIFSANPVS